MSYCIDTSALIEAWVRYYPLDVFPTLWDRFDALIREGRLLATDEVLRELEKKSDDLWDWANQRPQLFIALDQGTIQRASVIVNRFPSLTEPKRMRGTADPFVIAMAVEHQLTVVTAERSKPTKPRIPDVCQQLSVPWIPLIDLFRREHWTV